MHSRNESHHCEWSSLPNRESKVKSRAWNNHIIINWENCICPEVLYRLKPAVWLILYIDDKSKIRFVSSLRLQNRNLIKICRQLFRWWFILIPYHMYCINTMTGCIMSNSLFQKRILLPCVHKDGKATPELNLESVVLADPVQIRFNWDLQAWFNCFKRLEPAWSGVNSPK